MAFIPTGITSIVNTVPSSVQVGASVMGTVPVTQVTSPWIINQPSPSIIALQLAGSVMAVSGSFSATPQGSITIIQSAGSVLGVRTDNASVIAVLSNSSVTALQGTNPWVINVPSPSTIAYQLAGSVMAISGNLTANPQGSIVALQLAGSVMAVSGNFSSGNTSVQVISSVASANIYNPSVLGLMFTDGSPVNQSAGNLMVNVGNLAIGTFGNSDGTNPGITSGLDFSENLVYNVTDNKWDRWLGTSSVGAVVTTAGSSVITLAQGSVLVALKSTDASVVAVLKNSSVTALQGTNPWLIGNNSVLAFQGTTPWTVNSILGTYQEKNAVTASVFGFPFLFKIDETNSVLSAISPQSPLPVRGSIAVLQGTTPWLINVPTPSLLSIQPGGSVLNANISGSVAVAVMTFSTSVAANINVISASIVTNQGTNPWVIQSIVGTFADNTAFTTNDKGLGILGIRNDTVASIVNADKQYGQWAMDSAGRNLVVPFAPGEASIIANASVVNGGDSGSVVVFAAAGTGLRNYVTDYQVSNTGSVATLITFTEGGGSIIGRTIAPAGGGSNMPGMATPIRNQRANQPINMVTATASSVVYVAAYGYRAP